MSSSPARPSPEALLTHVEWVRRVARQLVADAHDAADVEQETWRHALERPPRHAGNLRAWLAAIARNAARRLGRDETVRARNQEHAVAQSSGTQGGTAAFPAAADVTARAELHRRVVDAVLALEELYRAPLLLRFFDDLPAQEVARRLGVPVETARTRIKRGLAQVRAQLGGEFGVDGGELAAALAPLLLPRGAASATIGSGATASVAAGAGITGLVLGGAFMSKLGKVGAAVAVVVAALFGTYKLWIEPRPDADRVADAARRLPKLPEPAIVTPDRDAPAAPAVVETSREPVDRATSDRAANPDAAALGTIEGLVLDGSGQAVAGATVVVDRLAEKLLWNRLNYLQRFRQYQPNDVTEHSWRATTSANDGSFRFEAIDPGLRWAIGALHDPLGTGWNQAVEFAGEPAIAKVVVALTPGVVIFGTVRDSAGAPIESAVVQLMGSSAPPENRVAGFSWEGFMDGVASAADGSYRSLPLPWRHAKIHVLASAQPDLAQLDLPWEDLPPGARELRRDLTLQPMPLLRGRILGPDGSPARLTRTLVPKLGVDARRTQTRQTIAVAAFEEDPRAKPELIDGLGTNEPGLVYLDTDHTYGKLSLEDDRYEIPLKSTRLHFVALIARDELLGVAEIPSPPVETDLVIDPGRLPERSLMHGLRLHLRDARDGSPLSGVSVNAVAMTRDRNGQSGMSMLNFGPPKTLSPERDLELPLTPMTIMMSCDGFASRTCRIDPSRAGAPTELTFEFAPAAGSVIAHVEDDAGQPIAGATLRIYRAADLEAITVWGDSGTDERGDHAVPGLAAGECVVVAEHGGFAPVAQRVTIGDGETAIDLVMERGYEVTVRARLADATPVPWGQFSLVNEDGLPLYDRFHPNSGPARLASARLRVVDGSYTIRCRVAAFAEGSTTFVAAPGATIDVELMPTQ